MRDIGARIQRYRLSRYAMPSGPVRRRLRWFVLGAALWLVWVGVASDHSFYRIWRLSHERERMRQELDAMKREVVKLTPDLDNPAARARVAERALRERTGMAQPGEIIYRIQSRAPDSTR